MRDLLHSFKASTTESSPPLEEQGFFAQVAQARNEQELAELLRAGQRHFNRTGLGDRLSVPPSSDSAATQRIRP